MAQQVKLTPKQAVKAVDKYGGNITAAAEALGVSRRTLQRRYHALRPKKQGNNNERRAATAVSQSEKAEARLDKAIKSEVGPDEAVIRGPFKSWQEAMQWAQLDPDMWELERAKTNAWSVQAKMGSAIAGNERFEKAYNDQVCYWFRRIVSIKFEQTLALFEERAARWAPKYPKVKYPKITDGHMLELSLFDAHFGKLAWAMETGENYDLKIAKKVYLAAFQDLLNRSRHYPIEKIVIPVGSDFLHIDNLIGTTTRGTPQHYDTRPAKIMDVAEEAITMAIDYARQVAPVEVIFIPGNHDKQNSEALCRFLRGWYRNNDDVSVDVSPSPRKYVEYGCNLIGFSHGDEENHRDLPTIMADEQPAAWARTAGGCHEYHVGHLHKKKKKEHTTTDTHGGTVVRTLPSLSGTDAWHFSKGYVKGLKAAQGFLYSKTNGLVNEFTSSADQDYYKAA